MSISGVRSNRGDGYQTLVALNLALTVISDPKCQWIEVDSVDYLVDDVVVGKSDGTLICCQCKKNQVDCRAWTIADMTEELEKASRLLASNNRAEVRFYSRTPFGDLAKLREHSATQPNETTYLKSLGIDQQKMDAQLGACLATHAPNLSTYDFLRHTSFENTPELERMEVLLHERLRYMACNADIAYVALWTRLDQLGARMNEGNASASTQHRLTKDDLKKFLNQAGAMLVPTMNLAEVRTLFQSTSAIGRSWHRDIAGQSIPRPILNDLLGAIDAGKRSLLLTGSPGSGKTCVMLALQEALEQRALTRKDIVPLFIQSREFADFATVKERQAQGLPEQWVEKAARISEEAQVIVVIDSLDVLSIAREHNALTYFLAQIDRLLLIPNITIITACRDFDRHYDHRIAERHWDFELKCLPLDWETEIAPLLDSLRINTTTIDSITRELIQNPRELALFVELAQRDGSFNVVTSQALAQRYLTAIVQNDVALGETAMKAIESIATEMLQARRLVVPHQRFTGSQDIKRLLCSLNVLKENQDGNLTFGHQTLLDVLVISGALRRGETLNEFIKNLPPVPFVRPSIRSFIAQLAMGGHNELRRQLRTVLTSNSAFHIRRLVAESLAEQKPQDDDWPLVRDLRDNHRDVFQVIYTQARQIEWYQFWLSHLVPVLKDTRDVKGLTTHAHRVSQWKNVDTAGVVVFWSEILQFKGIDEKQMAMHLADYLCDIHNESLALAKPLLERMIFIQRTRHSFMGCAIARCVAAGLMEDRWLWLYIAGDVCENDVIESNLNNKLHCQPYEFGTKNAGFLLQRMEQSVSLLNLVLESVERWSQIQSGSFENLNKVHRSHFLPATSYRDTHSKHECHHKDNLEILLDAMERSILHHAERYSEWWQINRERVCFNKEGALRYFSILACIQNPVTNIDLIGRMLCDRTLLKSDLSYELGTLIHVAFVYLDSSTQDVAMECILALWENSIKDEHERRWVLRSKADLIVNIPCYLRSSDTQSVLEEYEKAEGVLIRQPSIRSWSGSVSAPFSFEVFLGISDLEAVRLIKHYSGYKRTFESSMVGGEEDVCGELREASSRDPARFLYLLTSNWHDITNCFRDAIMEGIADYLAYRFGNLKANDKWMPLHEPEATALAVHIIDELEGHANHWHHNRAASKAIKACAPLIKDTKNATRLLLLMLGFKDFQEKSCAQGGSDDLIGRVINMVTCYIAEALMMLANNLLENNIPFPELLSPALLDFVRSDQLAIRDLILSRLPYLQSKNPVLGWELFNLAMKESTGLWKTAEPCLYYAYHNHFEIVSRLLARISLEGNEEDLETWGRISALAALSARVDFPVWLMELTAKNSAKAWKGASSVWSHPENFRQHRNQCVAGFEAGLNATVLHSLDVAHKMENLFHENNPVVSLPIELLHLFFAAMEKDDENKQHNLFWFDNWLNITSLNDPNLALVATEIYLAYVRRAKSYLYNHEKCLTQLMTRLFAEAEEREESDNGAMLLRVVSIQDTLLSLGVNGVDDWLKAAERP